MSDLAGEIDAKTVILFDSYFQLLLDKYLDILKRNYVKAFIECFPSGILLRQILNDKISIGRLVLDKRPTVVSLPSAEMKVLKEWDILLIKKSFIEVKPAVVFSREEKCGKVMVPDPELYILGKVGSDYVKRKCQEDANLVIAKDYRELPRAIKEATVDMGFMWAHDAVSWGLNLRVLEKGIIMEVGVIKGADEMSIKAFNLLLSEEMMEVTKSFDVKWIGK
ncbi:hypothetical protein [Metallosphaera javensis (ex Sakai et al. 2022)]|uniref:hypothetical protein n=1 Tax=Metallosphaera javensis (ex Sakai et al. 2022) TaxID=2775498 RepID=UPI00258F6CA5